MNISFLLSRRDYAALLLFRPLIFFHGFGGDSGGRFGGVGGLHVSGGCRDRPQRFAGHCSEGDCSEDDRAKQHNGQ